jgi:hypothetical protein
VRDQSDRSCRSDYGTGHRPGLYIAQLLRL